MPSNVHRTIIMLFALSPLVVACQHPPGYDDAWSQCQAEAVEAMERAEPDPDQRTTFQEQYIRDCMTKQGFSEQL